MCMQFKDLSFWEILKTWIILEITIPILLIPVFVVLYIITPDAFVFLGETTHHIMGLGVKSNGEPLGILLILTLMLISMLIQSALIFLIAQKTPLGRIRISNMNRTVLLSSSK